MLVVLYKMKTVIKTLAPLGPSKDSLISSTWRYNYPVNCPATIYGRVKMITRHYENRHNLAKTIILMEQIHIQRLWRYVAVSEI